MINAKSILLIILLVLLGALGYMNYQKYFVNNVQTFENISSQNDDLKANNGLVDKNLHYYTKVKEIDGDKTLIDLNAVELMTPNRNDIPALMEPTFVTVEGADSWISDEMKVALYEGDDGTVVVYPLSIMQWHQVLFDDVDDRPIIVTYCPFSGVLAIYDRRVEGNDLTFGVSGKIFNGNSLLFDNQTESLWQQINGLAVSGDYTGKELTKLPVTLIDWGNVREYYPDAQVLSRKNSFQIDYNEKPYGNYSSTMDIYYKVRNLDTLFHPKSVAVGFGDLNAVYETSTVSNQNIYLLEEIHKVGYINASIADKDVLIYEDPHTMEIFAFNRSYQDKIYNIKIDFEEGKLFSSQGEWKKKDNKLVLIRDEDEESSQNGLDNNELDEISTNANDVNSLKNSDDVENKNVVNESEDLDGIKLKRIPVTYGYWFAWRAFYPNSTVFTTNVAGYRQSFKDRD